MKQLLLMLGTRKGAFLAWSNLDRTTWTLDGPFLKGAEVNYVTCVQEGRPVIIAAAKSAWWGPTLRRSDDFGATWKESASDIRFAEGRTRSVDRIWIVEPGRSLSGAPVLYAGVDPGALFVSTNGGDAWEEVETLTDHPTRANWQPGAGGLMVHSICVDRDRPDRTVVGISAAGAFRTDDGGRSWTPKNTGVRADFLSNTFPDVGQCVHHMERHPGNADVLYQQNHCGVYRSENAGDEWTDISEGLPSRFGFPLAVHPHDGDTIFVVPEESDEYRLTPGGAFRVFRSRNRGNTWEALTQGLPQTNAHQNVLRHASATDPLDPPGVYIGTQGGQLVGSRDAGDHWDLLFNWLPPIYSVQTAVLER